MSFVIDCSILLTWFLPDEATEATRGLYAELTANGAHAPILLRYEITNALINAERRRRISAAFRSGALRDISQLPIHYDVPTHPMAMDSLVELAARHRLTVYDASYLALALDRRIPLATFDKEIIAAARSLSVPLF